MAEKDRVFKGKIKQSGIFNFKDFYEFLYEDFMEENYDVVETKYIERIRGDSKEVEIFWTASKIISEYFKFEISIEWLIVGMKKVKIKKEEQEITMDSGVLEVSFKADLIKDWNNSWENSFLKFFRYLYDNYIIKSRIEDYELKLFEDINEIIAKAKSFLAIEGQHAF